MEPSAAPAERLAPPWVFRVVAGLLVAAALAGPFLWIRHRSARSVIPLAEIGGPAALRPAMFLFPRGTFQMGSPADEPDRYDDEGQHEVRLTRPYLMAQTEVTQAQYEAVMGENRAQDKGCGPDCPVEQVSWLNAVAYCNGLSEKEGLPACYAIQGEEVSWTDKECRGYRLPTEAEWEYAARGGRSGEVYVGTSDGNKVCGFDNVADEKAKAKKPDGPTFPCDDGFAELAPVASFRPNGFHLYDMGGNVLEWCWDWYGDYPRDASTDPTGPAAGESRVLRGGSWFTYPRSGRVAVRSRAEPSRRYAGVGFRVARSWPSAVLQSVPLPGVRNDERRTPP